ncbi:MAG: hypothetical protein RMI43_02430 [Candidatus Caldarchaeum sp.]|nr:hypothetical protein [Candidatus Caldarchaeum sp.]MCX8201209.1 hypothetical protein [Candidatus Caldarchaeum sp.]MDW8063009.1 hypothetical protein [Candidatus Caldarchaeum sp.]MDW8435416.1 hypothetical protein [Candidatus Caldarchaeum sp.]
MIGYGSGALLVIVLTAGLLLIVAGSGLARLEIQTAAGVLLILFGAYTVGYSFSVKEKVYYVLWGGVAVAAGLGIVASPYINPILALGVALVFIALLSLVAMLRRKPEKG